ncbi:putative membrane protein YkgB [Agrococcus sp. UYP33]
MATAFPFLLLVGALLLGVLVILVGVALLVGGRRRGPDGGAGSAMLTFGITALVIGCVIAVPPAIWLVIGTP